MSEIEELKERVDRLEAERDQEKREKEQLRSEVEGLRNRVEAVEDDQPDKEKEQLRDRVDELETENKQLQKRVAELEEQPEINVDPSEKDPISTLTIEGLPVGRRIASSVSEWDWKKEIKPDLERDLTGSNSTPKNGETPLQDSDLTPIEQLSRAENVSDVTDSPSVERAVTLFKHLSNWGAKTPRGIVLKPADNPLSLLKADRDESLVWKQYYRAAETLAELSHGSVKFFNSDKHGNIICLREQSETFDRVVNGSLTASSVGTKG